LEARLGWVLGWDKETFRGRDEVEKEMSRGPSRLLTGVIAEGRQPLRDGGDVLVEGQSVGLLTSGNFSPVLERGIAMGLLSGDLAVGTPVSVALRGREIAAQVASLPFVRKVK
jgi:aminomethyltransferase